MKIFCSQCGNELSSDAEFCEHCGFKIANDFFLNLNFLKLIDFSKIKIPKIKQKWVIIVLIITASAIVIGGVSFGINKYQSYTKARDQQINDLITKQQQVLENSQKEINDIKTQSNQAVIDLKTQSEKDKTALQNKINSIQNEVNNKAVNIGLSDADIISEWKNRVAEVTCWWSYSDGTTYETDGGSATLVNITDHGVTAVTNKHVLTDTTSTYAPNTCLVGVYGNGARVVNYISPGNPFWTGAGDWGYIYLNNPDKPTDNGAFDKIVYNHLNTCQESQVALGDQIVILGYPAIGTTNGITATEGIISGLESDYYVTSAKIDHGNSGGAAILVKNDCWLGMPTSVAVGSVESLGRILKAKFVLGS